MGFHHFLINLLELSVVFLCFLLFLRGHLVLVQMDNTSTVAYINHQWGLHSRRLHLLACGLIL